MYRTVLSYVVPNSKRKWTVPVSRLVYVNHGNHAVGLLRIYLKYFLERKKIFSLKGVLILGILPYRKQFNLN
jgi:hypothetical protein